MRKRKNLSIQEARDIAKERNGKCLSNKYVKCTEKLKWICYYGHEWETSLASVRNNGSWCPKCNINVGEEVTRNIMNILFNAKFTTQYPEWLEGLELDGYNESLSIAFEYDGKQHYQFVRHFHRTKKGFEEQKERDAKKDRLCGENGVILIRVPYTVKYENIKDYICEQCEIIGIIVPNNVEINHREFGHIYTNNKMYEKLKQKVHNKGWRLISEYYVSMHDDIEVICDNGHKLITTYNKLWYDRQCFYCMKSTPGTLKKFVKIAKENNMECVSNKYVNRNTSLEFKCQSGHLFSMTPHCIYINNGTITCQDCKIMNQRSRKINKVVKKHGGKVLNSEFGVNRNASINLICEQGHKFISTYEGLINGSWCHACRTGKHSIQTMKKLAADYEGECLSVEYVNLKTKLKWRCKEGHEFQKAPGNIRSKNVFCFECYKKERYAN